MKLSFLAVIVVAILIISVLIPLWRKSGSGRGMPSILKDETWWQILLVMGAIGLAGWWLTRGLLGGAIEESQSNGLLLALIVAPLALALLAFVATDRSVQKTAWWGGFWVVLASLFAFYTGASYEDPEEAVARAKREAREVVIRSLDAYAPPFGEVMVDYVTAPADGTLSPPVPIVDRRGIHMCQRAEAVRRSDEGSYRAHVGKDVYARGAINTEKPFRYSSQINRPILVKVTRWRRGTDKAYRCVFGPPFTLK